MTVSFGSKTASSMGVIVIVALEAPMGITTESGTRAESVPFTARPVRGELMVTGTVVGPLREMVNTAGSDSVSAAAGSVATTVTVGGPTSLSVIIAVALLDAPTI